MDPRGFPTSLPEFQQVFPDDEACARYLESLRWPTGFVCPKCGHQAEPYRFTARPGVLRCRGCKANVSLTAGTVMEKSQSPLSTWFWGAYLISTQTPGQSAVQFQRQLGIKRYEKAFIMLHKLRAGMVRPERDRIGAVHPVEVDECFIGGRTRGEGRGVHHKATVLGAVEVRTRADAEARASKHRKTHSSSSARAGMLVVAGRLRLRLVEGRGADSLETFVSESVARGSTVRTDGCQGYEGLSSLGYVHDPIVLGGDHNKADAHLPMIHLVFSNLKTWILGTHHGVSRKHLQAYLNEYVFRFNRRFYPMTAFNSALGLAARAEAPTYSALYSGEWTHPEGRPADGPARGL